MQSLSGNKGNRINKKIESKKLGYLLHWIGLIGTCFMLVVSFLDQSQDELMIHLIVSSFPILIGWILRVLLVGRKHFLQCFWVFSKML